MILFEIPRKEAFVTFIRPDLKNSKSADVWCQQFFAYSEVKEYIKAYKETLSEWQSKLIVREDNDTPEEEDLDSRTSSVLKKLKRMVFDAVERGDTTDPEVLGELVKLLKSFGVIKDEENLAKPPERFLPEMCDQCLYKKAIDLGMKKGEVENTCEQCRALDFAKQHGFKYDPTRLLNPTAHPEVEDEDNEEQMN